MKVEMEYIIKKKMVVECEDITKSVEALNKADWVNGGRRMNQRPEVIGKFVIDSELGKYNPTTGAMELSKEAIEKFKTKPKKVESVKEWLELFKERTIAIQKENLYWTQEKCKFVARQDMPKMPSDGWSVQNG